MAGGEELTSTPPTPNNGGETTTPGASTPDVGGSEEPSPSAPTTAPQPTDPNDPNDPGDPNDPSNPNNSPDPNNPNGGGADSPLKQLRTTLAMTGAQVVGLLATSALLIGLGIVMIVRNRRSQRDN